MPATRTPFPFAPSVFLALLSGRRSDMLRALARRPHTAAELAHRVGSSERAATADLDRLCVAGLAERIGDDPLLNTCELTPEGRALLERGPTPSTWVASIGILLLALGAALLAMWAARAPGQAPALDGLLPIGGAASVFLGMTLIASSILVGARLSRAMETVAANRRPRFVPGARRARPRKP